MDTAVPDIVGEVTAFRAWRLSNRVRGAIHLCSITAPWVEWPHNDWLRAHCDGEERCRLTGQVGAGVGVIRLLGGPVPGVGCTCGIYAARTRSHLAREWQYNQVGGVVLGEVGLAGRIIPGARAHRAARARPLKLYVRHVDWRLVKPLEDAYQVPVELTNVLSVRGEDHVSEDR